MFAKVMLAAIVVAGGICTGAGAQAPREASRGELLYATHCIACHTTQVHWREKRAARDWTSLRTEVERWQRASGNDWGDEDVAEVARYLNTLHYRFPGTE